MTAPPGSAPDLQQHGTPGRIRVSKVMRHRLAAALSAATGMPFGNARALIAQRAGDSVDELEAWLRANYRMDPVGVTAVRRASRGRS